MMYHPYPPSFHDFYTCNIITDLDAENLMWTNLRADTHAVQGNLIAIKQQPCMYSIAKSLPIHTA